MMLFKKLFIALLFGWVAGCQPAHIDPPVLQFPTEAKRNVEAKKYETTVKGFSFTASNTHSMEPTIWSGDWLVEIKKPIEQVEVGEVITAHGDWQKPEDPPETHRVVDKDAGGLMVSGDNVNPVQADGIHSENQYRIRNDNYIGTVVRIYRVTKMAP